MSSVTPLNGRMPTQLSTLGGDVVELRGTDFGPSNTTPVLYSALYYSTVSQLVFAPSCTMTEAHVALQCTTVPGFGR